MGTPRTARKPRGGTTARDVLARRRQAHAAWLRSMRWTYQEIADARLPCPQHEGTDWGGVTTCPKCLPMYADKSGARKAVEQHLADEYALTATGREQLRQEHLATLALIIREATTELQEPHRRGRHDVDRWRSAPALIRALDQQARITGLYAPSRVQVTTELDEQIRAELEALGLNDPVTT